MSTMLIIPFVVLRDGSRFRPHFLPLSRASWSAVFSTKQWSVVFRSVAIISSNVDFKWRPSPRASSIRSFSLIPLRFAGVETRDCQWISTENEPRFSRPRLSTPNWQLLVFLVSFAVDMKLELRFQPLHDPLLLINTLKYEVARKILLLCEIMIKYIHWYFFSNFRSLNTRICLFVCKRDLSFAIAYHFYLFSM